MSTEFFVIAGIKNKNKKFLASCREALPGKGG
jgi:hypothetical protein